MGWGLTVCTQGLALLDLLQEVGLLLVGTGGEPFGLSLVDDDFHLAAVRDGVSLGGFLLLPRHATLVPAQLPAELGLTPPAVVEVDGVCCEQVVLVEAEVGTTGHKAGDRATHRGLQ